MDEHDEHWRLMRAHRERREVEFVPYTQRPSGLPLRYTDDGKDHVTCRMAVAGLGTLTLVVTAPLASVLKPRYRWELASVAVKLSAKAMEDA